MREANTILAGILALALAGCGGGGGGPTEKDITNSLDATLASVAGSWTGTVNATNSIQLEFNLQESAGGQLTGTGTMKEAGAAAPVPITVTGSYQRPLLTLALNGMVYENRTVKGDVQGSYTTVGGIGTTLKLTAQGYQRDLPILLQER